MTASAHFSAASANAPERAVGIIPARLGSTRFPAKVLANETGHPLIQHVYESASKAKALSRLVVATDDQRVIDAVNAFGGEAVITSPDHLNGTSRLAEAAERLCLAPNQLIVNVQGDEPELQACTIDATVAALLVAETQTGGSVAIGTAAAPFAAPNTPKADDLRDPNCVKVVCTLGGLALYFSRSLIPFDRDAKGGPDAQALRHIGIYVYRRAFLDRYIALPPTPLERAEQLEQLRALQHGYGIAVAKVDRAHPGIDTPEQYRAFVSRWKNAQNNRQ